MGLVKEGLTIPTRAPGRGPRLRGYQPNGNRVRQFMISRMARRLAGLPAVPVLVLEDAIR